MTTPLKRLLAASQDIHRHFGLGTDQVRGAMRQEFYAAIKAAQAEIEAQSKLKVQFVINKSWDMGWDISTSEAIVALSAVLDFPGRKIMMIKAFRTRTDDGGPRIDRGRTLNRLKRAKEIIEVAQEVLT